MAHSLQLILIFKNKKLRIELSKGPPQLLLTLTSLLLIWVTHPYYRWLTTTGPSLRVGIAGYLFLIFFSKEKTNKRRKLASDVLGPCFLLNLPVKWGPVPHYKANLQVKQAN